MSYEFKKRGRRNDLKLITQRDEIFRYLYEEFNAQLIPLKNRLNKGENEKILGKAPTKRNWQVLTEVSRYEEFGINGRRQNAGLITGDETRLIVVDVDNQSIFSEKYQLPETLTVRTGKGFHHYFKIPDNYPKGVLKCKSIQGSGFDIRANGGYVVAPGSIHAQTKKTYRIIDENAPLAEAPEWILELSKGAVKENKERPSTNRCESEKANRKNDDNLFIDVEQLDIPIRYMDLLESSSPEHGNRSDKLWLLLHQMVPDGCTDEIILSAVHYSSGSINEKYSEKGANRANWLLEQIAKARLEYDENLLEVITKNLREDWVQETLSAVISTLESYTVRVTDEHKKALEGMIRLFIEYLEGSAEGWASIPLSVGAAKTTTLKHVVLCLWNHRDELTDESLTIAVQKIEQIKDIESWLLERGVSKEFFSVIHSKVNNLKTAKREANQKRIVIVTHQRLNSLNFTDKFFTYQGSRRKLLVYDEQLNNGTSAHEDIKNILSIFDNFEGRHKRRDLDPSIPAPIIKYLLETRALLGEAYSTVKQTGERITKIPLPSHYLDTFSYYELLEYGDTLNPDTDSEKTNWLSLLLTLGKTEELEKDLCLFQNEKEDVIMLSATELLSREIKNLVTMDATREYNRLFRYTLRRDLKKVKRYDLKDFRMYDGLSINYSTLKSGKKFILDVFNRTHSVMKNTDRYPWESENVYIDYLFEIIKKNPTKKTLIFHSIQLGDAVKDKLCIKALDGNLYGSSQEFNEMIKFRTFGLHDATNLFSDCERVVFLGFLRKPRKQYLADLYAETLDMSVIEEWMVEQVEIGDLIVQLQQGTGRGTMRRGEAQEVYFFDLKPERFTEDFFKAFPGCSVTPWAPECLTRLVETNKPDKPSKRSRGSSQRARNLKKAARKKGLELSDEILLKFDAAPNLTPMKFLKAEGYI